jgi:hypothetical protein
MSEAQNYNPPPPLTQCKGDFFGFFFLCTIFHSASSAASQIPLYRRRLGLNRRQLRLYGIGCRMLQALSLVSLHTVYVRVYSILITQRRGWGGDEPERRLERQQFTKKSWVEITNMNDCISTCRKVLLHVNFYFF